MEVKTVMKWIVGAAFGVLIGLSTTKKTVDAIDTAEEVLEEYKNSKS